MKFIDAVWDTRNLGVRCAEVEFNSSEDFDARAFESCVSEYEYVAAKVAVGNMKVVRALESSGFGFAECSINFVHDLTGLEIACPEVVGGEVSYSAADSDSTNRIISAVRSGLFSTDRVYLDPHFTHEQAAVRYANWINDELARGAGLFEVLASDEPVGFFAYKEPREHISYPFLIGLYPHARGRGLGKSLIGITLKASLDFGCEGSSTFVSSNNPAVIRCHERVGSRIAEFTYVFTRHSGGDGSL